MIRSMAEGVFGNTVCATVPAICLSSAARMEDIGE